MKKVFLIFIFILSESAQSDSRSGSTKSPRRSKARSPKPEVIEDLFNVYDPSFLAVVWPKITNGMHVFVEKNCWDDVTVFFKDLAEGRAWAYNAVDASGRYQAGLFIGNTFWLGSKQQCLQLDHNFKKREVNTTADEFKNSDYLNAVLRREKYFDGGADEWRTLVQRDELMRKLVEADNAPPHRLAYSAVQLELNLTKITMAETYQITLGVCISRFCTPQDIASIINFSIMLNNNLKSNKTIPRSVKVTSVRQIEEQFDVKKDAGSVILICITIVLIGVTITATLADMKLIKCRARNSKSMSFDLQKYYNHHEADNRTLKTENLNHAYDNMLTRKESNVVGLETLTINNINNSNNINLVTVKKVIKPNAMPPSITLDVVSMERATGSCKRCGKYKKQCNDNSSRHMDTLPACPRVKSFASLTAEHKRKNKFFKSLVECFSLRYSWKRIVNTNMANKDLSVMHGLKIVATLWIIYVHVAMMTNYVSDDGGDINHYNNVYYILSTGTLAFDTLFFVSGLFSSHHFFFLKSQYTVEELVNFGGTCGQVLQFVCFVTNRAIRLLPSYACAIFLSAVLARAARHTSALTLPDNDDHNCDVYWWRNLLLRSSLKINRSCMQVSWYMSAETQLHVFGALTCALMASGKRVIATLAAVAILIATAADVSAAYSEFGLHLSSVFAAYSTFIERPLARVTPYFIGIFAGWLVHRKADGLHISRTRAFCLWFATLFAILASVSLPWLARAWVSSWLHLIWPIALLWPALIFSTDLAAKSRRLLDSPVVAALTRLCYSMLLLHGAIARSLLLSDAALCSHTTCIWSYFAGTTLVTALAALALSLLVETPCCSLLRRLSDYAT